MDSRKIHDCYYDAGRFKRVAEEIDADVVLGSRLECREGVCRRCGVLSGAIRLRQIDVCTFALSCDKCFVDFFGKRG
jgi:hypothetical protein